ncbi:hypothetical protein AB4039_13660 [Streptomyces sp. M-16]|uniref:hypothetical protein n=1 Tax=Streptomyces sp. M-16 TaxID=3233040 RepID=UPI0022519D97
MITVKTSFPGQTSGEARFRQVVGPVLVPAHLLHAAVVCVALGAVASARPAGLF